ncbi:putative isp4 protein-1 [Coleophoma crateriformis]|uniref:Putative isp4 protein-1 n=1 Tax=Coleophoma crateriformis TaxID=565419 RepID=A0A3D8QV02_9HELO|nr:putative isp4 protein-1 [Coleophoma crateriformis]
MKSQTYPGEALVVNPNPDDSLEDDETVVKTGRLTVDEGPELAIGSIDQEFTVESDNSPYPEVRANVSNVDDTELPVNTFRMWFLGIVFTMLGSGINQFFSMRYPSVTITSLVAQLLSFPLGCFLAHALPVKTFRVFGHWDFTLNPDTHFNIKEHAVITIMSNLSFGASWATDIIQAQKVFYGLDTPVGYQILLALSMQLFGLGLAGMAYKYIVEPPQMVWPATLANAALFDTLHSRINVEADGWKITRYRFFMYVFCGGFVWYWFPGFIFTALSTFAFICWAAPKNIVVNNLFGMSTGLGLMPTTFDWSQIAYNGSPLVVPFWAQANVFAGWAFFFALVAPIVYYTDTWFTSYLPLSGSNSYDNTASIYNVTKVVDAKGNFMADAYEAYSPIFMPATFAMGYGISFAVMSCLPVHVYLYHFDDIKQALTNKNRKDIHARLMSNYKDLPWWVYPGMTVIIIVLAIIVQEVWHTGMPVWGVFLAFAMAAFYVIPVGTVFAVANLNSNVLTVLGEIISGYLIPGKPIVMLIFKFYAYTGLSQAMNYSSDMKLGLYMKIPRRTLFAAQLTACILGSLTQNGVLLWMLGHIKGICDVAQPNGYTCPQGRVNFTSSIIWGAIGPARLYSVGKQYSGLLHLFWIGALLPVITFHLKKYLPNNRFLNAIHWPLFFAGTGNLPPATGVNYTTAFVVSLIFNKIIKSRYKHWWAKYNYILSASLDSGVAVSAIVIFFTVIFPGAQLNWWGNNVSSTTVDGLGTPWRSLEANATFGPKTW